MVVAGLVALTAGCSQDSPEGDSTDGAATSSEASTDSMGAQSIADAGGERPVDMDLSDLLPPEGGPITGLYVILAEGAAFTPCERPVVIPVAPGGRSEELRQRYLLEGGGGTEPALATVRAHVEGASASGGSSARGARLVVDSVLTVGVEPVCPGERLSEPLEGTAWQLTGLPAPDPAFAAVGAWIRLGDDGGVSGYTGCRDLVGRYEWAGTRLRFYGLDGQVGMCEHADAHAAFLAALGRVGSYRFRPSVLELMGEAGAVATLSPP